MEGIGHGCVCRKSIPVGGARVPGAECLACFRSTTGSGRTGGECVRGHEVGKGGQFRVWELKCTRRDGAAFGTVRNSVLHTLSLK